MSVAGGCDFATVRLSIPKPTARAAAAASGGGTAAVARVIRRPSGPGHGPRWPPPIPPAAPATTSQPPRADPARPVPPVRQRHQQRQVTHRHEHVDLGGEGRPDAMQVVTGRPDVKASVTLGERRYRGDGSRTPKRRMQAHPPGPGLPKHDPSVIRETFFIALKNTAGGVT